MPPAYSGSNIACCWLHERRHVAQACKRCALSSAWWRARGARQQVPTAAMRAIARLMYAAIHAAYALIPRLLPR